MYISMMLQPWQASLLRPLTLVSAMSSAKLRALEGSYGTELYCQIPSSQWKICFPLYFPPLIDSYQSHRFVLSIPSGFLSTPLVI